MTVKMGRMAVESGAWIMWEREGDEWRFLGRSRLIAEGKVKRTPLIDYLRAQGRFRTLVRDPERVAEFERGVEQEWEIMKRKVSC